MRRRWWGLEVLRERYGVYGGGREENGEGLGGGSCQKNKRENGGDITVR